MVNNMKLWALIQNGAVAEISAFDPEGRFHPDFQWVICDANTGTGDLYEDGMFKKPAVDPTESERHLIALVQLHMDERARRSIYDDLKTAISYADEPASPKYQAEGKAFRAWRSLVWEKFYSIRADVVAGLRSELSPQELISLLPELVLPN